MDKKEFDVLVMNLKKSHLKDDDIMHILVQTYETKQCSLEDLEIMVDWLGYSLTDDFYKDHKVKPTGILDGGSR